MEAITLVLLAAGSSTRFGMGTRKQWLYQGHKPLWQKVADDFVNAFGFEHVVVTGSADDLDHMRRFGDYAVVAGGATRQASLRAALQEVVTPWVLVNDVARCCLDRIMVERVIAARDQAACIVPVLGVTDTLYLGDDPVDRTQARRIQTPQLSRTDILKRALESPINHTDESSAIRALGESIHFVPGSTHAHKLTHAEDLNHLACLEPPAPETRVGFGIDTHPFEQDKPMKLCGVALESPFGFKAHSDGDVALHAVIDALLGAAGLGDIGEWFPDTDAAYAGADSAPMLEAVIERIRRVGLAVRNVDLTIVAQIPRILPYKDAMRQRLASLLDLPPHRVNLKATTSEKLGFIGREEGVTVHAVASLGYFDWTQEHT